MKPIQAILVLYKMPLEASPTWQTLSVALGQSPALAAALDLLVVDNSAQPQSPPPDFAGRYLHDGTNPGLARRYNTALAEACASGATWLLLLDQDTCLTSGYCEELLRLSEQLAQDPKIVAIAPRLVEGGRLQSPHLPVFRRSRGHADPGRGGLFPGLLRVYNSGALLRVAALEAIAGFPEQYWLDYLDHATFHRLQQHGGGIYVMQAELEHEMSIHRPDKHRDPANAARHTNQLAAENLFFHEHGQAIESLKHRVDLARNALRSLKHARFAEAVRLLRASVALPRSAKAAR